MTGYQETLTDPSYRRQVVVATAPQIGNTGWVAGDGPGPGTDRSRPTTSRPRSGWPGSSSVTWRRGRRTSGRPRRCRQEMERQGVVGIAGVDTRALTRHLRTAGAMRCGIFTGARRRSAGGRRTTLVAPGAGAAVDGRRRPDRRRQHRRRLRGAGRRRGDLLGRRDRPRASRRTRRGCWPPAGSAPTCCRRPPRIEDIKALGVDGVFLSNGPGDPATADAMVELTKAVLDRPDPVVRHLLRQPDPRPGTGFRHLQAEVRAPRDQPAGARSRHRPGAGHLAQPRVRRRRPAGRGRPTPSSAGSRSPSAA